MLQTLYSSETPSVTEVPGTIQVNAMLICSHPMGLPHLKRQVERLGC